MYFTTVGWFKLFKDLALWLDEGKCLYHAELSSGLHSNGFFNSEKFFEMPGQVDHAARDLMELLQKTGLELDLVDRVVGPAMGAITIAHDLARSLGRECSKACRFSYTEKKVEGENGTKKMAFRRSSIYPHEKVLLVEDVLTTGGSVLMVKKAVEDAGGEILPFVAILVNRSGLQEIEGLKVVSLFEVEIVNWSAEDCPLCQLGSKAIRPKEDGNWDLLTRGGIPKPGPFVFQRVYPEGFSLKKAEEWNTA
jgi:orotate phosphoribosyltransferase